MAVTTIALNGRRRPVAGRFPAAAAWRGLITLGPAISRGGCRRAPGFVRIDAALVDAGCVPERLGYAEGIDANSLPPALFVADAVYLAVVHPAKRDGELVARLASERARLRIAQMMRVGR